MSLTKKRAMTEKNLAAHRLNGPKSRGAVTPEGKARAAAANLRHGLYSKQQDEALLALGEDPQELADLMQSLQESLQPAAGLESELVKRMGRTLWRMKRMERMQDGLAQKRMEGAMQTELLVAGTRFNRVYDTQKRLEGLWRALRRPDYQPSPSEIATFRGSLDSDSPAEMRTILRLLESLGSLQPPEPGAESAAPVPPPGRQDAQDQAWETTRRELQNVLLQQIGSYEKTSSYLLDEFDKVKSGQNRAALMAPRGENALVMQRMEDSSLRQLWRLTNLLIKVRSGRLTPKKDVKNEGWTGNVIENQGKGEIADDCSGIVHETASVES